MYSADADGRGRTRTFNYFFFFFFFCIHVDLRAQLERDPESDHLGPPPTHHDPMKIYIVYRLSPLLFFFLTAFV